MGNMMQIKRGMMASQPHIATASSGNTEDSSTICHITTDVPADVQGLIVSFEPVQSGSGTQSPSNVRAISGIGNITVSRTGKNLYNESANPLTLEYYINGGTGTAATSSTIDVAGTSTFIRCSHFAGETITMNSRPPGANPGIAFYSNSSNASYISGLRNGNASGSNWTFDVPNNANYMRISVDASAVGTTQIELGSDSTSYEPYNIQTLAANLPETVYKGYLDLVNGVLVKTMGIVDLGSLGWAATEYTHMFRARIDDGKTPSNSQQGSGIGYCDAYNVVSKKYADMLDGEIIVNNWSMGSQYYGICVCDHRFTDSQIFKAQGAPGVHLVYELNTPVTYQLTPQTLKTLRGINNIWSDQGTVEVKYWTH